MKWFLILLVFVAGGLAWAAHSTPNNAALVNGVAITQHELNSDVSAIANSADYQCYANAQAYLGSSGQVLLPPVDGVGQGTAGGMHPTATTAFAASYLDTAVGHQLVLELAAQRNVMVTPAALATARTALGAHITVVMTDVLRTPEAQNPRLNCGSSQPIQGQTVLASMPSSFVDEQVKFDATITALEENLSGVGSTPADMEGYFNRHRAMFDLSCITLAVYPTASDAQAAAAKVKAGTPFANIVAQATQGGPQGCIILYDVSSSLPASANLPNLPLNTLSAPIPFNGEYLLVEITARTATPYSTAETSVQHAVQALGSVKSQRAISTAERSATIVIDARYGKWVTGTAQIVVPASPIAADVLNPMVNIPAASSGPAGASGVPSSSTGQSG